jgi:hypothetical protein
MSHTREPWHLEVDGTTVLNEDLSVICDTALSSMHAGSDCENARRIVACVNFCAGLSTEIIENSRCGEYQQVLLKERDTYRELCVEMLEALQTIKDWEKFPATGEFWESGKEMSFETCYGSNGARDYMRSVASSVITKAEKLLGEKK